MEKHNSSHNRDLIPVVSSITVAVASILLLSVGQMIGQFYWR